jgi:DNA-directed RNA polymerase subunit M/transcription elongation factor TFIIS
MNFARPLYDIKARGKNGGEMSLKKSKEKQKILEVECPHCKDVIEVYEEGWERKGFANNVMPMTCAKCGHKWLARF